MSHDIDIVLDAGEPPARIDLARVFRWPPGTRRPVELEVGCGKGLFLVQLAARRPERDFLALEVAGSLVRKVASKVERAGLTNVRLLRADAKESLALRVAPGSIARMHVHFPDPWPKRRHAHQRFFAGTVPDDVARVLEPGGELLLSTDHDPYFREVVARLACHPAFVRTLPDAFRELPRGGFDAIFERAGVPAFRGSWERVREIGGTVACTP